MRRVTLPLLFTSYAGITDIRSTHDIFMCMVTHMTHIKLIKRITGIVGVGGGHGRKGFMYGGG